MKPNTTSHQDGFSLIEVMIFIIILSMVLIVALSYVVNLLRTMNANKHRVIATYYADELREWLRSEKETDWDAFAAKATGQIYCFNADLPLQASLDDMKLAGTYPPSATGCGAFTGVAGHLPTIFKREVTLTKDPNTIPPTHVDATITVYWMEQNVQYSVPIKTSYTLWE